MQVEYTNEYILKQIEEIDKLMEMCKPNPSPSPPLQQQCIDDYRPRCFGCNVVLDSDTRMFCGTRFECSNDSM